MAPFAVRVSLIWLRRSLLVSRNWAASFPPLLSIPPIIAQNLALQLCVRNQAASALVGSHFQPLIT